MLGIFSRLFLGQLTVLNMKPISWTKFIIFRQKWKNPSLRLIFFSLLILTKAVTLEITKPAYKLARMVSQNLSRWKIVTNYHIVHLGQLSEGFLDRRSILRTTKRRTASYPVQPQITKHGSISK